MKKFLILSSIVMAASALAAEAPKSQMDVQVQEISAAQYALMNGSAPGRAEGGVNGATGKTQKGIIDPTIQGGFQGGGFDGGIQGGFQSGSGNGSGSGTDPWNEPYKPTLNDRIDTFSRVITAARDVVSLGQELYELVNRGKPSITTEFAPLSVVPRDPTVERDPTGKEIVYIDPFELENFSMPVEKNYLARVKDFMGREAVLFTYKVVYSYGGSYNGAGKYLTGISIIPGSVKAKFGWTFSATMTPGSIINHGTKADPVAGLVMNVKYKIESIGSALERNDTIHITGAGLIKNLSH